MLLGQTLDSMRVWDIRNAIRAAHARWPTIPLTVQARGDMAVNALYASLVEDGVTHLDLSDLPTTQMNGPDYLNVLRILDVPQAFAMAAERCAVTLHGTESQSWQYPKQVALALNWPPNRLRFEAKP
jgi:hypothetical protein